jgi:hypothetical protein
MLRLIPKSTKFGLLLLVAAHDVAFADAIYSYTGNYFTYAGNSVLDQYAYSASSRVEFTAHTPNAWQGPGFAFPSITSWSITDGTQTFSGSSANTPVINLVPDVLNVMKFWTIHITPECVNCFITINTTNNGSGQSYDWGQNVAFNYGGNWRPREFGSCR